MCDFEIVKYPNDVLTTKTERITVFDEKLQDIVEKMADIMYSSNGAGIAANQVGLPISLFLIDNQWFIEGKDKKLQIFINPEILEVYGETVNWIEGCLSFDKIRPNVPRYRKIKVRYQGIEGNVIENILEGDRLDMVHRFQHEYDHVVGRTFLDNLSREEQLYLLGENGLNLSNSSIIKCIKRFDTIRGIDFKKIV